MLFISCPAAIELDLSFTTPKGAVIPMEDQNWWDLNYTSRDGLRLYGRHYPSPFPERTPLLCLAGLTRNSNDFHTLATYVSAYASLQRDVYTLDYRGRGQSEYDNNWRNYTPLVEARDVLDFLTLKQLHRVSIFGTSRGGLIAMLLGALRPTVLASLILNDIGPRIERQGLLRIRTYVGRTPHPNDWEEAGKIISDLNGKYFPNIDRDTWIEIAHSWYNEQNGLPEPSYDPNLSYGLSMINLSSPIPEMWPQFRSITRFPAMVIRGGNSDLLSLETVKQMQVIHKQLRVHIVVDEGHAPLLRDEDSVKAVDQFLLDTSPMEDRLQIAHDAA